jgi:multiple sugar transport system ATP-binding protein
MRKVDKATMDKRVRQAAELLHIEAMLERRPAQMSGGQRQRVAVARAIAVQTEVLLMDEPLSNLDALLRLEMRAELKRLLAEIKATTIYVTHDQIEALSMGDRIAVMRDGEILQCDHPTVVYDRPANHFIGGFIGNPPMNFLEGQVRKENGRHTVHVGGFALTPAPVYQGEMARYDGKPITIGIRAENMEALSEPADDALKVRVLVVEPLGSQNLLTIQVHNDIIKLSTHPDFPVAPDSEVWVRFPADKIRWMDRDTKKAIYPA